MSVGNKYWLGQEWLDRNRVCNFELLSDVQEFPEEYILGAYWDIQAAIYEELG